MKTPAALNTRSMIAGLAMLGLIGSMVFINVRSALRYGRRITDFQRFVLMAAEQCSSGNANSTQMLLVRVRSLAPDAADEDYAREAQVRFRSGECTIITHAPPVGFVDLVNP